MVSREVKKALRAGLEGNISSIFATKVRTDHWGAILFDFNTKDGETATYEVSLRDTEESIRTNKIPKEHKAVIEEVCKIDNLDSIGLFRVGCM